MRTLALLLGTALAFEGLGRLLPLLGLWLLERPAQALLLFPALSFAARWTDSAHTQHGATHDP